ncbi:restriction endonuclease subunit S [Mammaliicoccus sciuri]|uniref:restriction endonuclease subunit S n=1 Tax=Mammaliicoccus sciuri TaxID=1296 RepID=UPI00194EC564
MEPILRFPEFESEWENKNLENIVDFAKGKLLGKKDLIDKGRYPCILYGELYTKYGPIINDVVSRTDVNKDKLKKGSKNQILIPSSGETTEDIATASTLNTNEDVYIGGDLNILTPKEDDGKFISLSLNGVNKRNMAKLAQGKTVVHLYNNDLKTLNINLPKKIQEQQKIGEFFSKLDRQIELEEQKLAKLEEQKKGYMQKLFSQELRFKDENGDDYPEWVETNIRNTFDNKGGTALEKEFDNNGTHKVISIGSYSMNSTYNEQNIRINKNEFTEKYLLNEGDLAMVLNDKTKEGNIIGRSIYIDEDDKYIYNQRTERLIPVTGNNHKFLWYLMNSEQFRKKIKQMMQGATQVYINYNSIKDLSIYLPILEEQNKIENFLGDIFNIIKNQSDKVELLKRRKKGFLQKMFV